MHLWGWGEVEMEGYLVEEELVREICTSEVPDVMGRWMWEDI